MMPLLCGYCPRRIVARDGQHVGKGVKALGKVVPLRTILSSIFGIWGSRERSASSMRMNRMFGFSAPPLADSSPPQAANNSTESPMRRPINSTTRRDGLPISEWSMPLLLLSSLISVADMLTLGVPLSREVGEGLPKVREFWWELSLGPYRGMGAEFLRLAADRGQGLQLPKLPTALAATRHPAHDPRAPRPA